MYLKFWMTLRIVARNLCSSHFIKVPAVLGDERKQGGLCMGGARSEEMSEGS